MCTRYVCKYPFVSSCRATGRALCSGLLLPAAWNASRAIEDDPILTTFGTEVGVHVESMGKYSFQKAFRLRQEEKTFPLHTAIISVDEGEVRPWAEQRCMPKGN